MYVPIIIDPCEFYDYRYLWEYLMYQYHCSIHNWPIITEEAYRDYRSKRPISNVYEEDFCRLHQYLILSKEKEASINKYYLDSSIFRELEIKQGSKLGAKLYLLQHRYKPLEKAIIRILKQIKRDTGKNIKGVLNWNAHFLSVRYAAQKLGIPVITNEFSLRFPEYYPLGYFCKSDIYASDELQRLYENFLKHKSEISFSLLSRKEILALILEECRLECLDNADATEAEYEIGIAGCHPMIPTFFAKSTYTDLELIGDVRNQYAEEDILFRKHPGDEPYQANYTLQNRDESKYASEYILRCKRIAAIGSNTILEALLWGRTVYTNHISPFHIFCNSSLEQKDENIISDEALNFVLFGYLIPYNKMFDPDYMEWRLHEDDVAHIVEENIKYCFKERGIPSEVIYMEHRYEHILTYRKET